VEWCGDDYAVTPVSLLGRITHMIRSMPSGDTLMVTSMATTPARDKTAHAIPLGGVGDFSRLESTTWSWRTRLSPDGTVWKFGWREAEGYAAAA